MAGNRPRCPLGSVDVRLVMSARPTAALSDQAIGRWMARWGRNHAKGLRAKKVLERRHRNERDRTDFDDVNFFNGYQFIKL